MDGADSSFATPRELEKSFAAALGGGPVPAAARSFLAQFAADVLEDHGETLPLADLGAVAADLWRFAETRKGDGPAIRLQAAKGADGHPLDLDLLEIVQPDAPFLVDSVMGELADAGLAIRAMAHPVSPVSRDGKGPRTPSLTQNNVLGVLRACQKGLGVAMLPDYLVEENGGLVQLFGEAETLALDAYFVYPEELKSVARIQVFRDFLVANAQRWHF